MKEQNKKRILMIEDNIAFLKIVKMRLEAQGYQVLFAQDGLNGLGMIRKENPDLIISDLMLPGLDGHKIIRMIKFDKNVQHIPVIMLTSRDLEEDVKMAKKCGADAFLVKTVHPSILMDTIHQLLSGKDVRSVPAEYLSTENQSIM